MIDVLRKLLNKNWLIHRIDDRIIEVQPFSGYERGAACNTPVEDSSDCVLGKEEFPTDFFEAAYTAQICLACIESY